jgi:hypothetical protein
MQTKQLKFNVQEIITRSPRLETVIMVENFIKENSGGYKKTKLFQKLPKKIMWGTFNVILKYLYDNNKIGIDKKDYIIYIWNPELIQKLLNRKRY